MVVLGLLSLVGIIVNNAIVLINRIEIERNGNPDEPLKAMIKACTMRLRPILMTTITTVVSLLPLIVSRDPLFFGMATVIAAGLLVGTLLNLAIVPVLYAALFRLGKPVSAT